MYLLTLLMLSMTKKPKKKASGYSPSKQPPKKKQRNDKTNSPHKEKEKAIETTKDTPLVTIISDPTQPPTDASELDILRFQTAVNEQAILVERLKKQFELKHTELQALSAFGPPTDNDSDAVKAERKRINALTLRIDSFLSASLNNLVDTPVYLFDTTETNW
ncbi:hypothetical protein L1887_17827 [Cichorium endivia]|nr:hypothetical protein L1887_17827 [Cichorium endivia]